MNFEKYIENAKKSNFGLWKLNFGLFRIIPFNKPHGIRINKFSHTSIETIIPYKRKNLNHIKGIHACGLATCAEFASGFLLLTRLNSKQYRLIMESIEMIYHYQAKTDVIAKFNLTEEWLTETILNPLKETEAILIKCTIELYDIKNNHIATGTTNWQIKEWSKVRTKV
tara:strand:+ start:125 stop:631 length:507 start_codon:yes stop_codon:yes gene_type:complete